MKRLNFFTFLLYQAAWGHRRHLYLTVLEKCSKITLTLPGKMTSSILQSQRNVNPFGVDLLQFGNFFRTRTLPTENAFSITVNIYPQICNRSLFSSQPQTKSLHEKVSSKSIRNLVPRLWFTVPFLSSNEDRRDEYILKLKLTFN